MPRRPPAAAVHGVRPELAHLLVPIEDLHPYPGNSRTHAIPAIVESLEANGQYKPITVRDDGTVLAGHGTLNAAKSLGWTHIAATPVTCDDDRARRIVAADNRTHDQGSYDRELLAAELRQIQATSEGLAGTAYDDQFLADLEASLSPLPDLDDLADEHGEPSYEDGLVRVWFMATPETAAKWKDALQRTGVSSETVGAKILLDLALSELDPRND